MTVKKAVPSLHLDTSDVHVVTPDRWSDVAELFERLGPRGGAFRRQTGCWCQFWHLRGKTYWAGHGRGNHARLEEEIRSGSEPRLARIRRRDPDRLVPARARQTFERLEHSPRLARVDDQDVWLVVCFYVHPSVKRNGVASVLLDAAIARATALMAPFSRGLCGQEGAHEHRRPHRLPTDVPGSRLRGRPGRRAPHDRPPQPGLTLCVVRHPVWQPGNTRSRRGA